MSVCIEKRERFSQTCEDGRFNELHQFVNLNEERNRDLQFGTMAKFKVRSWGVWQTIWTDNMPSRLEACS